MGLRLCLIKVYLQGKSVGTVLPVTFIDRCMTAENHHCSAEFSERGLFASAEALAANQAH